GELHPDARRDDPPERARLPADDVVARSEHLLELARGDLAEADRADEAGSLAIERPVDLVEHALRLDRSVLEVAPAQHPALALLHLRNPARAVGEPLRGFPLASDLDELLERRLRVRDDPEIGAEDTADLHRLDVDVDELAALRVDLDRAGVAVRPAVAEAEHEVALSKPRVALAVLGPEAPHPPPERMGVGDPAPPHYPRGHPPVVWPRP